MKQVDFLIVGQGLSGTALAQRFLEQNKSFTIVDRRESSQASRIASGIWNPVVLKRMKKVWRADDMLDSLYSFYLNAEKLFQASFSDVPKVNRLFANEQESNEWIALCDQPQWESLLSEKIQFAHRPSLKTQYGMGEVKASGRVDTERWLDAARAYFLAHALLREETLNYDDLKIKNDFIVWQDVVATSVVFCEGMHASLHNPYFRYLPFAVTKGEVLVISAPELKLDKIVSGGVFILPLGNDLYKVGATYAWNTYDLSPTDKGKQELVQQLEKMIDVPYEIVDHQSGIRPNVKDRRPLLGTHPEYSNVHIFNGMGSRGVLMAPWLSDLFVGYLLYGKTLPADADISRFS